jgi:hypothetical protein
MRMAAAAVGLGMGFAGASAAWAQAGGTAGGTAPAPPGITGTRAGVNDAWISADAVVLGVHRGPDSTLGPGYHVLDVRQVWAGDARPGRLVFKAPRGVRGPAGDEVLVFLWDRLAGASDSFLEEAKQRYGEAVWQRVGPDSLAVFLLPFPNWSYPLVEGKLVLRGQNVFPTEIGLDKLRRELDSLEKSLAPESLFRTCDTALHARVEKVDLGTRTEHGSIIERWVIARFLRLETWKGAAPDTLLLRFVSVPRSPRFRSGEEVVLLLARSADGLYLEHGKRAVLHVQQGEVLEAGRPLAELRERLRAP